MKMGQEWDIGALSAGQVCCKSFLCNDIKRGKTTGKMRHSTTGLMAVEAGQC